jgi:hypothetical protein
MTTLINALADYFAESSGLVIDTNFYIGADVAESEAGSVVLREIAGSGETESHMITRSFQMACKGNSYMSGLALAETMYALINHKPGYSANDVNQPIFYVRPLSRPMALDRDVLGNYIFVVNFIIKMA